MSTFATIAAGQKIQTRSLCDYDCIYEITVVSRTAKMATVIIHGNKEVRCKIYRDERGEYLLAHGHYSMAPSFHAEKAGRDLRAEEKAADEARRNAAAWKNAQIPSGTVESAGPLPGNVVQGNFTA